MLGLVIHFFVWLPIAVVAGKLFLHDGWYAVFGVIAFIGCSFAGSHLGEYIGSRVADYEHEYSAFIHWFSIFGVCIVMGAGA